MTYVIEKVKHIKQLSKNLCWATCGEMLYQHKGRAIPTAIVTPPDQKQIFSLEAFAKDGGFTCAHQQASQINSDTIELLLRQHGPLIATIGWYSNSAHLPDHAILIVGVDSQYVYYDNPAHEKGVAKHKMSVNELKKILGVWPCKVMYLK